MRAQANAREAALEATRRRLDELLAEPPDRDTCLRQVVGLLHEGLPGYDWVGIYLLQGEDLVVHNFRGRPTPHERIKVGEGICGAAISQDASIIVDDVHSDPRYLACSLETAAEIVIPLRVDGRPVGEIDIDSDQPRAFGEADRLFLEDLARRLEPILAG